MKKLTLLLLATMAIANVWAQTDEEKDLIYKSNHEKIEAKILEVSSKEIKYKDWNNQSGPTFVLEVNEIDKIQYSTGKEQTFTHVAAPAAATPAAPVATYAAPAATAEPAAAPRAAEEEKQKMELGFQANIDLEGNLAFLDKYAQGGVDLTLGAGVRMAKFLYIGAAAGVLGEWGNRNCNLTTVTMDEEEQTVSKQTQEVKAKSEMYLVPIFADARLYAPARSGCYFFGEVGVGGFVGLDGKLKGEGIDESGKPKGGFYLMTGVGLEFKYFTIGAGYKLLRNEDLTGGISSRNHGYLRLGVSLGRSQKIRK